MAAGSSDVLPCNYARTVPRVVSEHQADAYSMRTFAGFRGWRDLEGDARAWEVYRYLVDRRTGLFPLGQPVVKGQDVMDEFRIVRDPVKLINVYGYGFSGILGPTMVGVCEGMGIGPARTVVLPGWNHTVTLERPGTYNVTTAGTPVDESIDLSVARG